MLIHVRHSEALYEDDSFPERELAALVAAKVYYQLQEYNESMVFALGAGKLFDIHKAAEFEETIMGKTYTSSRNCDAHMPPWHVLHRRLYLALAEEQQLMRP
jgi:26S proteasome regulatory subunit N2